MFDVLIKYGMSYLYIAVLCCAGTLRIPLVPRQRGMFSERSGVQIRGCATLDTHSVQTRSIRNQKSEEIKTPGYRILSPIRHERRHMQTMRQLKNRFVGER